MDQLFDLLNRLPAPALAKVEQWLKRLPPVRAYIEAQYAELMPELEASLHPYRDEQPTYRRLPATGCARADILDDLGEFAARENKKWSEGLVSGAVYEGDPEHVAFLNQAYALSSQTNPLHADIWPSTVKFEAEIVAMTASMLGADATPDPVVGTVTSGGTESILLAMKSYRDRARLEQGIDAPELIVPSTAHAAFEKAAHYFGIKLVQIPVGTDFRADVQATAKAITTNTIALVGSAPSFPHGVIDPIAELAALAQVHGIGFHCDACLGAFVLPWARKLGAGVPPFDFSVPGVTSLSADTHKYGYAAKGTSVVLYRGLALRRYQYYTTTEWPGGLYFSPTLAGSRPGGLSAACWAAMLSYGEAGYLEATRGILAAARYIRGHIDHMPDLQVLGDPLWVIAFGSRTLNIYAVMAQMSARGWSLNGLHHPPAIHIAVTKRHAQPGVAQRFVEDLQASVAYVKAHPTEESGMAPVYGMAATLPMRGVVSELLRRYIDALYSV